MSMQPTHFPTYSFIPFLYFLFFFNVTATAEIYTLSLHDALPIYFRAVGRELDKRDHREGQLKAQNHLAENKRSEEHTSELQSRGHLVCRLLLEKKKHLDSIWD